MQGRGIVKEIVKIRGELNCMHQYYSILHQTFLEKVEVLLHDSNVYICTGEHDDNKIFLHEIDWKIKINNSHISLMLLATLKIVSYLKNYCYYHHDNRHIVKSLCLPQSHYQHVLTEFEYQLELEFVICIE